MFFLLIISYFAANTASENYAGIRNSDLHFYNLFTYPADCSDII